MQWSDEQKIWLGLHLTKGLGAVSFWRLIDAFGSALAVAEADEKEKLQVTGITARQLDALPQSLEKLARLGESHLSRLADSGATVLFANEQQYPFLLKTLNDPPPVLIVLGELGLLEKNCLAVVGSRACTGYGKRVANSLAKNISERNVCVVSGLALGIDTAAHMGALEERGKTIAVLGCGVDVVYPKQNKILYNRIAREGLLVSEYPLGTSPEAFRFPARNRIIAGLSRGVLVVEAAKKSGSLITAQMALDNDREVFAVPGQVDSYKSEGAHWLLKQGAKLVQGIDDIVAELPDICDTVESCCSGSSSGTEDAELEESAKIILANLEPYPMARDELISQCGLEPERVSEWLLFLELDGKVELLPGDEVRKLV